MTTTRVLTKRTEYYYALAHLLTMLEMPTGWVAYSQMLAG